MWADFVNWLNVLTGCTYGIYIYKALGHWWWIGRTLGKLLFQFAHGAGMAKRVSGGGEDSWRSFQHGLCMALKHLDVKKWVKNTKKCKKSWSVIWFFAAIFPTEIDFFVTQWRFWINSLQPTNPGVKKSHFVPPAFGVWIMSLGPGDGVMVFGCTKTMVCWSALLEQSDQNVGIDTGFWALLERLLIFAVFLSKVHAKYRVYSSIFFNPRQNRHFSAIFFTATEPDSKCGNCTMCSTVPG